MKSWIVLLSVLMMSCQSKPAGEKAVTGPAQGAPEPIEIMAADEMEITSGKLAWTASKTGGEHMGSVELKEGTLVFKDEKILTGRFVLDMNTIANADLDGEMKTKLENHLKSGDFFDVENYPSSEFVATVARELSGVATTTHELTGDLTIKDITRSITVPIDMAFVDGKVVAATPPFTINRTEWNLNYRSGILGTAADKLINDEISIVVTFEAGK